VAQRVADRSGVGSKLLEGPVSSVAEAQRVAGQSAVEYSACRACDSPLTDVVVDLGMSPLCESFLPASSLNAMERFFPLVVYVCSRCLLVQLDEYITPADIFTEYAYFSSYSSSWIEHGERYTDAIVDRLGLGTTSRVVELASNDGYLLQHFVARGIPALGVEPARNVASVAIENGIETIVDFFGAALARAMAERGLTADLVIGNNVLAQVPDLRDFIEGVAVLLKPAGTATFEFPHVLRLLEDNQFDTIYHEHFSYFSVLAIAPLLERFGLCMVDVDEVSTHGGSLRLYVQHAGARPGRSVQALLDKELAAGLDSTATYKRFGARAAQTKRNLLRVLGSIKDSGATIAGYGAPGKGNTLLNYCGIRTDYLDYTVDRNPHKHGKFLPGTHIPIHPPSRIFETRPDYVVVLPWNLRDEIVAQMAGIRDWGGRFIIPIPHAEVVA
jgi:SAM-dependent methyltransferase